MRLVGYKNSDYYAGRKYLSTIQCLTMTEVQTEMVRVQSEFAIRVLNVYKTFFPDTNVINGLNMSIPMGSV